MTRLSPLRFWFTRAVPVTWESYRLFCRAAPTTSRWLHLRMAVSITASAARRR